jgi:hypothetical protein
MNLYAIAFIASFGYVGLKSVQQLNVVHRKYIWIVPVSMLMAAVEVFVVASVAKFGWGWLVFWVGLGSGLGSLCATWAHSKFSTKEVSHA